MAEEIIYKCIKCGRKAPLKEWQRIGPEGAFKCPVCSYRVAKKIRSPIAKRVSTD